MNRLERGYSEMEKRVRCIRDDDEVIRVAHRTVKEYLFI